MYDLIIIGGGPAGLSAGMYAGRANLKTLVIDKGLPGGQMQNTLEVENYPGFKQITGPELSEHMHEHMLTFGAEFKQAEVEKVSLDRQIKKIFLVGEAPIQGKAIMIASGAQPRYLNVAGERQFSGRGVSYCATCDGAFFRNKKVVVVGGGDSAVEEGLFLTRYAQSVTIIHRRAALRAQPILQERAFANEKISFIWNSIVSEIKGEQKVTSVMVSDVSSKHTQEIDTDGVFIYVGFTPNTEYLKDSPVLNAGGYIETDMNMATTISGVFAVGDVRETNLRQIVTAASDGAIAAMASYHYLETL